MYRNPKIPIFHSADLENLISTSDNLKSIHFEQSEICDISNQDLLQITKYTNISITFGQMKWQEEY